jgi:hypothetical protein
MRFERSTPWPKRSSRFSGARRGRSWETCWSAADARRSIQSLPALTSTDLPEDAVVHYNLTWASEREYDDGLTNQALSAMARGA